MFRRARTAWIALLIMVAAEGCQPPSGLPPATATQPIPLTLTLTPITARTDQPASPTMSPSPVLTPTDLPDFKAPLGDQPGWLRYQNLTPNGNTEITTRLAFSPDGRRIAYRDVQDNLHIADLTTGQQTRALQEDGPVADFAFSPDGMQLAAIASGRLDVWDLASGEQRRLTPDHGSYGELAFSPDGSTLAIGPVFEGSADTSNLEMWETKTWTRQRVVRDGYGFVFSPDGKTLAAQTGMSITRSSYNPGPPVLLDVATSARRALEVKGFPISLDVSPDGKTLAVNTMPLYSESGNNLGGGVGTVLLDIKSGQVERFIPSPGQEVIGRRFSADGSLLGAAVYSRSQLVFWEAGSGEEAFAFDAPPGGLYSLTFSPDGRYVAAVSDDGRIILWLMPR